MKSACSKLNKGLFRVASLQNRDTPIPIREPEILGIDHVYPYPKFIFFRPNATFCKYR